MPFIDFNGNPVDKGVQVTDEVTLTGADVGDGSGTGTDSFTITVDGLASVDEVVDVSIDPTQTGTFEEVDEGQDLTAEVTSITDNDVTVQFYTGNGTATIASLNNTSSIGSVTTDITVTAKGY